MMLMLGAAGASARRMLRRVAVGGGEVQAIRAEGGQGQQRRGCSTHWGWRAPRRGEMDSRSYFHSTSLCAKVTGSSSPSKEPSQPQAPVRPIFEDEDEVGKEDYMVEFDRLIDEKKAMLKAKHERGIPFPKFDKPLDDMSSFPIMKLYHDHQDPIMYEKLVELSRLTIPPAAGPRRSRHKKRMQQKQDFAVAEAAKRKKQGIEAHARKLDKFRRKKAWGVAHIQECLERGDHIPASAKRAAAAAAAAVRAEAA